MKERTRKILMISFGVLLISCIIFLFLYDKKEREKEDKDIYKKVEEQVEEDPIEEEPVIEEPVVIPIDFAELKKINEDIYAWIDIEDTNVHYPIVQSATDDSYYLEHTIEGVKGYPGSIYTEKVNAKDFSDFNTLIYGHDMRDGSMFKHLHKFEDPDFFETHDIVTIYTETEIKTYRIYAAVVYDDRHIMHRYDNDDMEDRKAFIQSLREVGGAGSLFREDMTIDENSNLITMSTCITGQPDKRYIVVAAEIVNP